MSVADGSNRNSCTWHANGNRTNGLGRYSRELVRKMWGQDVSNRNAIKLSQVSPLSWFHFPLWRKPRSTIELSSCWNSTDTTKWYWEAEEYSLLRNKGLHCLKKEHRDIFLKIQHWLLGLHCLSFWKISIYGYADCKDERYFSQSISMYSFYDTIYFYETFY